MGNEKPTKLRDGHALRLMMSSWCTARLPIAVPMATIIRVPRFETRDICFQARHQRSGPATLDCFRQEAPRVGTGQLSARIGCIMACQELRIGQQLIDLAVAKDPLGSNCSTVGGGACEGPLVQRTHRLDVITRARGAQGKLRCQLLRIGKPGAAVLRALVSGVSGVRLERVPVALPVRCGRSVRLASDGVDQTLSGCCCSER